MPIKRLNLKQAPLTFTWISRDIYFILIKAIHSSYIWKINFKVSINYYRELVFIWNIYIEKVGTIVKINSDYMDT